MSDREWANQSLRQALQNIKDAETKPLHIEIERLTRRLEGATRLLNAWHFEYHYGRRLEGIDDDTTTWLGGIDVPDRTADQPAAAQYVTILDAGCICPREAFPVAGTDASKVERACPIHGHLKAAVTVSEVQK